MGIMSSVLSPLHGQGLQMYRVKSYVDIIGELKVVSAILGRNINDHIHLIFPNDLLAARPIIRPSKKRIYVCSEITHVNKRYYQLHQININSIPTNH